MNCQPLHLVTGYQTRDGAGVKLVRVLSRNTVKAFDPFLMLDSFDSENPSDYIAGFPFHPHRGIETISYIYRGQMLHQDSLGNKDLIHDGEVQWMTAGSGIMHAEKLPASERMLGVQLWLNLAKKDKMVQPAYHAIKAGDIEEIPLIGGKLRLLAGKYLDYVGYQSNYQPLDYYDVHLQANQTFGLDVDAKRSIMLFTLVGEIMLNDQVIKEKTAVKLSAGDRVEFSSLDRPVQVLYISSCALNESVAWGGPIVMNTKEELYQAFDELEKETFLRDKIAY
ncbi:MAG TPA: pirin family protein [Bacilli bacterium]|jgi:hypothetical protein|nr:pirin family protein [Bacilli bacterium]MDD3388807.1 pirin family protein [Bacilli bacterium]MDD4344597.1 pirin family protein [Bacilli bacterium]MDD4520491.1 pirin family protein [Bacilli bacterium]MDY0399094.1 pirin family protein [Bacilli bacterium]